MNFSYIPILTSGLDKQWLLVMANKPNKSNSVLGSTIWQLDLWKKGSNLLCLSSPEV